MSPFKFECPKCAQRLSATEDQIGTSESCPSCGTLVVVVAPRPPAPPPVPIPEPKDAAAERPVDKKAESKASIIKLECPKCAQRLSTTEDQIGTSEPCPSCGTMVKVVAPRPAPPPAPKDVAAKPPAEKEAESKAGGAQPTEAPPKLAPPATVATDAVKGPVTVDTRHLATDAPTKPQKDREPARKKTSTSEESERSPVSGERPPAVPVNAFNRTVQRIMDSRFLTISIVIHAIVVLMAGGVVLYPAIMERPDFEAGGDGSLVQAAERSQMPDLPSYNQDQAAEFAAQAPPLTAPLSALVTAAQTRPTWTVKMVPPSPVRGLSDSMKGALTSMNNRVAQASATSGGNALGRAGGGMRSGTIFGRQIMASRLGVILDVSGSAQPHLAVAIEEIQKGFGDAILILYPGCGMMRIEGKPDHVIRNLASIPPEEYPANSPFFTTAAQIADVIKIPEFEQMMRRPALKNTLFVSWTGGDNLGPDKLTNETQVAFEDLVNRGVDAIYWFADFEDPIDPRVADPLIAQLTFRRVKVHLHNFAGKKINSEATNIAEKTGGTMNTDKPKK